MPLERCAPRVAVQKEPAGLASEKLGERDCSWPKWNTEYRIAGSIPLSLELLCTSPSFYPFQLGTYFEVRTHNKAGSALPDTPANFETHSHELFLDRHAFTFETFRIDKIV